MEPYKVGDLVWAKMKGFTPWPGMVTNPISDMKTISSNSMYCIFFFGTDNYAWIKKHNIKPYLKFKDMLTKMNKSQAFKKAVEAIDNFIKNYNEISSEHLTTSVKVEEKDITSELIPTIKTQEIKKELVVKLVKITLKDHQNEHKAFEMSAEVNPVEKTDDNDMRIDIKQEVTFQHGDTISFESIENDKSAINIENMEVKELADCHIKEESIQIDDFKCVPVGYDNKPNRCDYLKHEYIDVGIDIQENTLDSLQTNMAKARGYSSVKANNRRSRKQTLKEDKHKDRASLDSRFLQENNKKRKYGMSLDSTSKYNNSFGFKKEHKTSSYSRNKQKSDYSKNFGIVVSKNMAVNHSLKHEELLDKNCTWKSERDPSYYKCNPGIDCSRKLSDTGYLKNILNTPYGIKNHACKKCPKIFSNFKNLKCHTTIVHTANNNFMCNTCDKKFDFPSKLERHISSVHKRKESYSCQDCNKIFYDKYYLKNHISRVHMKIRKYSCAECNKAFCVMSNLKMHIHAIHMRIEDML